MEPKVLAPSVLQYDFPEELAKNIIDVVEQAPASIWEKSGIALGEDPEQQIRTSVGCSISEKFPFWESEIRRYFMDAARDYAARTDHEISNDEGLNLLRYDEGVGKYDYHADASWTIYRVSSALIYLNPQEYEGGETHFKYFDINVKPEKPSIVFFPANYAYIHAARPTTKGSKYVIVTWMNDLPVGYHPALMYNLAVNTGTIRNKY